MPKTNLATIKNYSEVEVSRMLKVLELKGDCHSCFPSECPLFSYCQTEFNNSSPLDYSYQHHMRTKVKMAKDRLVFKSTTLKKIIRERNKSFEKNLKKTK